MNSIDCTFIQYNDLSWTGRWTLGWCIFGRHVHIFILTMCCHECDVSIRFGTHPKLGETTFEFKGASANLIPQNRSISHVQAQLFNVKHVRIKHNKQAYHWSIVVCLCHCVFYIEWHNFTSLLYACVCACTKTCEFLASTCTATYQQIVKDIY